MISALLGGIGTATSDFGVILTNAFEAVTGLFVTPGATDGVYDLTLFGSIFAIVIAATVITFAIRLLVRLVRSIRVSA